MSFIFGSLLASGRAKVTAMCQGLAVASLLLLAAQVIELDALVPGLLWDDVFFGRRWPYLAWYYLADALAMGSVAAAMHCRPALGCLIGIGWTSFVLVETLFDVPTFAHDPHMLMEELLFVAIYGLLLVLLAGCGLELLCAQVIEMSQPDMECLTATAARDRSPARRQRGAS